MRAKFIHEAYGAGLSMYSGGGMRGVAGRGGGFGGGSNFGGPNMMYTYEILPLNATLQPKQIKRNLDEDIHIGTHIRGKKLGEEDGKYRRGIVLEIVKTKEGAIKYYVILHERTASKMKINPTTALIIYNAPEMWDNVENDLEKGYKLKEGLVFENLDQLFENKKEA